MASWDFGPSSAIGDDKDDATAFTAAAGSYTNFRFYCITFSTLLHKSLPLLHELPTLLHKFLIFFYDFSTLNNSAQTTDSCTNYRLLHRLQHTTSRLYRTISQLNLHNTQTLRTTYLSHNLKTASTSNYEYLRTQLAQRLASMALGFASIARASDCLAQLPESA